MTNLRLAFSCGLKCVSLCLFHLTGSIDELELDSSHSWSTIDCRTMEIWQAKGTSLFLDYERNFAGSLGPCDLAAQCLSARRLASPCRIQHTPRDGLLSTAKTNDWLLPTLKWVPIMVLPFKVVFVFASPKQNSKVDWKKWTLKQVLPMDGEFFVFFPHKFD